MADLRETPVERIRWKVLRAFSVLPTEERAKKMTEGDYLYCAAQLLLDREVSEGQEQAFYEKLLKGIDEAYSRTNEAVDVALSEDDLTVAAMQLALTSCAAKAACEEILGVIREKYPEEDPKARIEDG